VKAPPGATAPKPANQEGRDAAAAAPAPRGITSGTSDVVATLLGRGPQFWISRVGIGLLLAGVAYLFKYAVDQGWLTPPIRVAFGLALGAALATIGVRVRRDERWFTQVMLGGAAATWYITGFAAFQLLHVVSFPVAFAFMVLVTAFTFVAGLQQDEAALAVLAAIGGLGTPFFLYTETGSVPGLMAYTSVVLVGTSAIYFFKGWRSLLWTTAVGAWLVVALGFRTDTLSDRIGLQCGVVVIWLLFGLVPMLCEVRGLRHPASTSSPPREDEKRAVHTQHDLAGLTLATAVIAFFTSRAVWAVEDTPWGVVALAATVIYVSAARRLSAWRSLSVLTSALGVTAAALMAIACALLFEPHIVFVLWAVEATALHLLARQLAVRETTAPEGAVLDIDVAAHILYAAVGVWMINRLLEIGPPNTAVLNTQAIADAAVIVATLVAARWVEPKAAPWYRLAAHLAILGWLWRELSSLPAGDGIVTATWGIYGLAILLLVRSARNVALATLFLAAGKLVVYDLSQVEPIWRILLFLSFGGVFLAISYYFTDLWSGTDDTAGSDGQQARGRRSAKASAESVNRQPPYC
jgi:uncharacterized membrane protein